MQNYQRFHRGKLLYYVFDLLWLDGRDLKKEPLLLRKVLLRKILPELIYIRFSEYIQDLGKEFFSGCHVRGLERGVIGKNPASVYQPGKRSRDWIEIRK